MNDTEAQEARYEQILGDDDLRVSSETLKVYRTYIQEQIAIPCELTGIEDFQWEEYYVLGPGDKKEYEKLKKTRPSYEDLFTYIDFDDLIDDTVGLMVNVRRISDNKQFVLPLVDLKASDKDTPNYQLLHDYSVWYINY